MRTGVCPPSQELHIEAILRVLHTKFTIDILSLSFFWFLLSDKNNKQYVHSQYRRFRTCDQYMKSTNS